MRTLAFLLCASTLAAQGAPELPAVVNHRSSQSPVKNQGGRGTCAAFAIAGALETYPGIPTDLSEQLFYATVKLHQQHVDVWLRALGQPLSIQEGDQLGTYLPLFQHVGTCHESVLPYDPNPRQAAPSVPDEIKRFLELTHLSESHVYALRDAFGKYGMREQDCTLLDRESVRDVERLKAELARGRLAIPVGYRVHAPSWTNLAEVGMHPGNEVRTIIHPGMMHQFARPEGAWMSYVDASIQSMMAGEDFVDAVNSGRWRRQNLPSTAEDGGEKEYGGHAVLIVGYDERGFLVKNSWGTDWGDAGYATIAYDYHRLYALQGVLIDAARIRRPELSPFKKREGIEKGRWRLKVQPRNLQGLASWQLSTWMEDPKDADVEVVEYTIRTTGAEGKVTETLRQVVVSAPREARRGAPLSISGAALLGILPARAVQITVRYGDLPLGDASKLHEARWLATRIYPAFAPKLDASLDLAPLR